MFTVKMFFTLTNQVTRHIGPGWHDVTNSKSVMFWKMLQAISMQSRTFTPIHLSLDDFETKSVVIRNYGHSKL